VSAESLQAALGELGMKDLDELYEKVGLGERLAPLVARRLLPAGPHDGASAPAPLSIAGAEGLLVTSARCCFPIPNDPIIAFLSSGRGIVIHRENCVNVEDYRKHPEKWLPVTWQSAPDRHFSSEIRVDAANRTGVLAAVAAAIASTDTNIDHVSVETRDENTSVLIFEIKVKNRKHLARIVRIIRRMPDVLRVTRTLAAHARDYHKFQENPKGSAP
jgi:(p)ppGpp synthase/HD superfamily hydrolase